LQENKFEENKFAVVVAFTDTTPSDVSLLFYDKPFNTAQQMNAFWDQTPKQAIKTYKLSVGNGS